MITYDDLIISFPNAAEFDPERVESLISVANAGLPDSRFKGSAAMADQGRMAYVMHQLTKPAIDLAAPHVIAQMGDPRPNIRKPHVWDGTEYGETLKKAVK